MTPEPDKVTFTTKFTEPTMERLRAAAEAANVSVSVAGAHMLEVGLGRDKDEEALEWCRMSMTAFRVRMIAHLVDRESITDEASAEAWRAKAEIIANRLTHDLQRDAEDMEAIAALQRVAARSG